jgi:hypothetical protein
MKDKTAVGVILREHATTPASTDPYAGRDGQTVVEFCSGVEMSLLSAVQSLSDALVHMIARMTGEKSVETVEAHQWLFLCNNPMRPVAILKLQESAEAYRQIRDIYQGCVARYGLPDGYDWLGRETQAILSQLPIRADRRGDRRDPVGRTGRRRARRRGVLPRSAGDRPRHVAPRRGHRRRGGVTPQRPVGRDRRGCPPAAAGSGVSQGTAPVLLVQVVQEDPLGRTQPGGPDRRTQEDPPAPCRWDPPLATLKSARFSGG